MWIENRILVIFDDVYSHAANTVQFTLHYDGAYKQQANGFLFENDGLQAMLRTHEPTGITAEDRIGHTAHRENEDKPYLYLSDERIERMHLLIHTLELDPKKSTVITRIETDDATGILIADGNLQREIWYNHRANGNVMHDNSQNTVGGYDTDAYMLMITRDNRIHTERVFAVCASFLRKDGNVFISEFKKTTAEITASV